MRLSNVEVDFQSLVVEASPVVETSECSECSVTLPDRSKWLMRKFSDPAHLEKETLYWQWVNRFFPHFILERRTVYRADEIEKKVIGSIWEVRFPGRKKLLETNAKVLCESDTPLLFAILYFLGQSYLRASAFCIDSIDQYRIGPFLFPESQECILPDDFQSIPNSSLNNAPESLSYFLENKDAEFVKFKKDFWIALMNIAFMSNEGWHQHFIVRQQQLREKIFESNYVLSSLPVTYSKMMIFCRYFLEQGSAELDPTIAHIVKSYQLAILSSYHFYLSKMTSHFFQKEYFIPKKLDDKLCRAEVIENSIQKMLFQDSKCSEPLRSIDHFWPCFDLISFIFSLQGECVTSRPEMGQIFLTFNTLLDLVLKIGKQGKRNPSFYALPIVDITESYFADKCVLWLKQTVFFDLSDVLLNKKLMLCFFQFALEQYRGLQAASLQKLEFLESFYQRLKLEDHPSRFFSLIVELTQKSPIDFHTIFLKKLLVAVYYDMQLTTAFDFIRKNADAEQVIYFGPFVDKLFDIEKVSLESIKKLDVHFKDKMSVELKADEDSQPSGFRTSGTAFFSTPSSSSSSSSSSSRSSSSAEASCSNQASEQQSALGSAMSNMTNWLCSWKKW